MKQPVRRLINSILSVFLRALCFQKQNKKHSLLLAFSPSDNQPNITPAAKTASNIEALDALLSPQVAHIFVDI